MDLGHRPNVTSKWVMPAREPDSQQQGPGRGCGAAPGTGPDGDAAVLIEHYTGKCCATFRDIKREGRRIQLFIVGP